MKSDMKKKTVVALSFIMAVSLTACSEIGGSARNEDIAEQISDESNETKESKEEGIIVTYRIVDKNPSDEDVEETIKCISQRIKEYTRHSECAVNDDEITFELELDPEEYDVEELIYELGRKGELFILDEENYNLWSRGEEFEPALTGSDVKNAKATMTNSSAAGNSYLVQLELTDEGTGKFADFTTANVGNVTYIIFDGDLIMSPKVIDPILNGELVILGLDSFEDAKRVEADVTAGALPLNLDLVDYEIMEAEE